VILFFDRSLGIEIPQSLKRLKCPTEITYHQEHFASDLHDDIWLPDIGRWGWFVIGQDYSYHKNPSELAAIKQHGIGAFYLWGAEAPRWESMRVFARGYDNIVQRANITPRPFVFIVQKHGGCTELPI